MNMLLPDSLKEIVDRRAESGNYGTRSEYLRELIRKDQGRMELRRLIEQGLESPTVGHPEKLYWEGKRRSLNRKP